MIWFGNKRREQPAPPDTVAAPIAATQDAEALLRDTTATLRAVLEATVDLVHLVTPDGQLRYVNQSWYRTLGAGDSIDAFLAPSVREAYYAACRAAQETGTPRALNATFHSRYGQVIAGRGQLLPYPHGADEPLLCGLFQNATAQEFEAERVGHRATHDPLTNLANEAYFTQHLPLALARARRQGTLVGLAYIDIDNFGGINAQVGPIAGDEVLIAISDRLKRCVRTEDLLARLDGDHFVLALERLHTAADARFVLDRIITTITTPLLITGDEEIRPEASIGIALSADPGVDTRTLLRAAEGAMRQAKGVEGASFAIAEGPAIAAEAE